jgi:hypothetical protein
MGRNEELKQALAMEAYFALPVRDYYRRYRTARLLCLNNPEQRATLEKLKQGVEAFFGKSLLSMQLLLQSADDLNQSWTYEIKPMETRTITVMEAVGVLDSFTESLDDIIAGDFLPVGAGIV